MTLASVLLNTDNFAPSSYIEGAGIGFSPDAELKKYMRSHAKYERVPLNLME